MRRSPRCLTCGSKRAEINRRQMFAHAASSCFFFFSKSLPQPRRRERVRGPSVQARSTGCFLTHGPPQTSRLCPPEREEEKAKAFGTHHGGFSTFSNSQGGFVVIEFPWGVSVRGITFDSLAFKEGWQIVREGGSPMRNRIPAPRPHRSEWWTALLSQGLLY